MVPASGQTPRRHQGRLRTRAEPDGRARAQARMHVDQKARLARPHASRSPWCLQDIRTREVALRSPFQGLPAHAIETQRGPHGAYHSSLTTTSNPIMVHIGPPPSAVERSPTEMHGRVPGETTVGARERFPRQGPPWVCSNRSASRGVRHNKPRRPGLVPYPRPTATSGGVPQRGRRLRFMTGQLGPGTHTHTHTHFCCPLGERPSVHRLWVRTSAPASR